MLNVYAQLEELQKQLTKLAKRYERLQDENELLSQKISEAQNRQAQDTHKLKLMEAELSSLRVAQGMVRNEDEVKLAKAKIGTLVREIDRCIALLNE
jgi:predicted nuclease with TOPRIM domain